MSNKRKSVIKNDLKGEAKTFIIIVIVVLVIIVLLYFLTSYLSKNGNFGGEYVTTPTPEAVMTYEDATVGTSLNRVEDEYYVVFEDFGDENKSFISSLVRSLIFIKFMIYLIIMWGAQWKIKKIKKQKEKK